jgi:hypothetical protein
MNTDALDRAYQELCAYTLVHGGPEFIHQHVIDAHTAQRADQASKPIALAFALVGLYLHVERGVSGRDVQRVHMKLARARHTWPTFDVPPVPAALTVIDVVAAPPGPQRDAAIHRWCESVWEAWRGSRARVLNLLASELG